MLLIGSLTFGLFFGAGNLIFPASLGLQSGTETGITALGFLLTAVGLPIIGVIACALAGTTSLHELASRVGPVFAVVFTTALYLTIGPFFAVPRTATVSYEMGFAQLFPEGIRDWSLLIFTLVFFGATAIAALRPGKLMDIVGKYLTPIFLVLLATVLVAAMLFPMGSGPLPEPIAPYDAHPAVQGLLDGYNTMDALASLAFSIVVLEAVRRLGIREPRAAAGAVARGGIVAAVLMGTIYVALAFMGAGASSILPRDTNGAVVLSEVANHYYGRVGLMLAAAIMLVACLKTAIGLVTACSEMFAEMFPKFLSQRAWVLVFTAISCALANVGLETIISASIPVLGFLYPLAIVLIFLALANRVTKPRPMVNRLSIAFTTVASLLALAPLVPQLTGAVDWMTDFVPGYELGFAWVLPALIGAALGFCWPPREPEEDEAATGGSVGPTESSAETAGASV